MSLIVTLVLIDVIKRPLHLMLVTENVQYMYILQNAVLCPIFSWVVLL